MVYNFRYDSWDSVRFPGYQTSVSNLYDNSLSFYMSHDFVPSEMESDIQTINKLFGYMEYYLAGIMKLRFVGKNNFLNVLTQMKDINLIKLLDRPLRNRLNGLTYNKIITLNPSPGSYPGMDQATSLQLSLYHELGHIITASNKDDIEYLKKCVFRPKDLEDKYLEMEEAYENFGKGFDLLDEVVVQNVAEAVLYDRNNEKRPELKTIKNKLLYPNGLLHSNFVEYREFQELAYRFAKCLSFLQCGEDDSMDDVLNKFSKAMFSRDFSKKMFMQFTSDSEKGDDLVMMLICMGKIKEAKYSSFGLGSNEGEQLDVSSYFELFDELAKKHESIKEDSQVYQKVQS